MTRAVYGTLMATALAAGLALRVAAPDARPMHHDEANQAVRFGLLLETGRYEYDRTDHHGPTLYYLTLPSAWLRGETTLASLDERTVRIVPELFGAGLILLLLPLAPGLGRGAAAAGAWLVALSPVLTYYSRFYIQESLFTFFALACLIAVGRWAERPRAGAAAAAGLAAGLAYATKETTIIVLPAVLVAALAALGRRPRVPSRHVWRDVALGLAVALGVAFAFYSSFGARPAGFLESIRAFGIYVDRGLGASPHLQPWSYYLRLLAYSKAEGVVWTEAFVLALAVVGLVTASRRDAGFWPRYVGAYAVVATVVFSLVPYKTPWNVLPFYIGAVIMAGYGAAALLGRARPAAIRILAAAVLVLGAVHLGLQNWRANVTYPADPRNPWVYAQTTPDFLRLVRRIDDLSAIHPDGRAMLVAVVAGPYEQWPLPWYLRRLTRVGYWTTDAGVEEVGQAPVIVVSQEHDPSAERAFGERYVSEFYGLRPDVILTLYVERGLWERLLAARTRPPAG